jgi:hypothetical protein
VPSCFSHGLHSWVKPTTHVRKLPRLTNCNAFLLLALTVDRPRRVCRGKAVEASRKTASVYAGYALFLSPNLTPQRDMYFLEKLVGLQKDSFQVSTLFTCLFNAMGMYPLIFLALLQPSGKSDNKVSSNSRLKDNSFQHSSSKQVGTGGAMLRY